MKAETLKKRINENLTEKGELKKRFAMIFDFIEKGGKYYGKRWIKNGSRFHLNDSEHHNLFMALLKIEIDFIQGNDSPKGGKEGDYIELTAKGKRQTAELRKELRQQRQEREEIQRQEREEAQRREAEAVERYKKDCEQTYNYLRESANLVLTDEQKYILKRHGKTNKAHKALCFELSKFLHVQNNEGFKKYLYELAK